MVEGRLFGGGLLASGPSIESCGDREKEHAASHRLEGDTSPQNGCCRATLGCCAGTTLESAAKGKTGLAGCCRATLKFLLGNLFTLSGYSVALRRKWSTVLRMASCLRRAGSEAAPAAPVPRNLACAAGPSPAACSNLPSRLRMTYL